MNRIKVFSLIFFLFVVTSCGNDNDKNIIEASGNIESTEAVVSSQVTGEIIRLIKDEGDKVSAGDTILIIDPEAYQFRLDDALAQMSSAEAQYQLLQKGAREEDIVQVEEVFKQAQTNFSLANNDKERFTALYETKSISKKQYEEAIARYDNSFAQLKAAKENYKKFKNFARPEELKQAEANLNRTKANVDLIRKNLDDCYVTSPVDGVIVKKFVEKGETVSNLSSLFKVSDLNEVDLMIYIPETDLGKVKLGQVADIKTDTYADKTYKGKVIYISPEAEFTPKNIQTEEERTKLVFAVKIRIPNPEFELKSGMPADASVHVK
jgi:HlyD family secretion protein